ncbi:MAG TPA: response regulator transcription factor [Anaerolineae bacterium]|nr:response regulator transcription factor [Anaerolineae bacterium]
MATKILIVDDEKTTRTALCEAFRQMGFSPSVASSGNEALTQISNNQFEVVILDIEMPGIKGDQVLTSAQKIAPETAFIVLTGHASTDTAITALRSGAHDYLRKPASLDQIFTAVTDALDKQDERRRQREAVRLLEQAMGTLYPENHTSTHIPTHIIEAGQLLIDTTTQLVTYNKQEINTTPIEYKLICKLAQNNNIILTYAQLAYASHDLSLEESEARTLLRPHLYRLRRKLEEHNATPIKVVRGRGIMLKTNS